MASASLQIYRFWLGINLEATPQPCRSLDLTYQLPRQAGNQKTSVIAERNPWAGIISNSGDCGVFCGFHQACHLSFVPRLMQLSQPVTSSKIVGLQQEKEKGFRETEDQKPLPYPKQSICHRWHLRQIDIKLLRTLGGAQGAYYRHIRRSWKAPASPGISPDCAAVDSAYNPISYPDAFRSSIANI